MLRWGGGRDGCSEHCPPSSLLTNYLEQSQFPALVLLELLCGAFREVASSHLPHRTHPLGLLGVWYISRDFKSRVPDPGLQDDVSGQIHSHLISGFVPLLPRLVRSPLGTSLCPPQWHRRSYILKCSQADGTQMQAQEGLKSVHTCLLALGYFKGWNQTLFPCQLGAAGRRQEVTTCECFLLHKESLARALH